MKDLHFFTSRDNQRIARDLSLMEKSLYHLKLENAWIRKIYKYLNQKRGKLLRPRILYYLCHLYRIKISPEIRTIALCLEIIHTAALLHDDVFDHEIKRRNKASANIVFGDTRTILAGDYLLVKACEMLGGIENEKIAALLYKAAMHTCSGEMDSCDFDDPENISLKRYLSVVERKTASLFKTCGSVINEYLHLKNPEVVFFTNAFGQFYQILDDLIDSERLLKEERPHTTLKDVVALPLVFLLREDGKRILRPDTVLPCRKILALLKKSDAYPRSLEYMRKKYRMTASRLGWENPCLIRVLENIYGPIESFLRERCIL
jgi:octaprenyl-diphosphate synthase